MPLEENPEVLLDDELVPPDVVPEVVGVDALDVLDAATVLVFWAVARW